MVGGSSRSKFSSRSCEWNHTNPTNPRQMTLKLATIKYVDNLKHDVRK